MTITDLFAGVPVTRYAAALPWYERVLGTPAFFPNEIEAVWELAAHRYLYIVEQPEHAGHARVMMFMDDLDALIQRLRETDLEPSRQEDYPNAVRKITYRDPDGNEIAFGGMSSL